MYLFEKYIIRILLTQFLFLWLLISFFLMLLKFQSFGHLNWPLEFQIKITSPFLGQVLSLSAPFALALAAIQWQEKMTQMKCFEAAASLGYQKSRFSKLKASLILIMAMTVWGIMNIAHPLMNQHQGETIQEAAQYFNAFKSNQFVKKPSKAGGSMVLYHHHQTGQFNDYFMQLKYGNKITYYWVNQLVSKNNDNHWLMSFGEGRQIQTTKDHNISQWSQFGNHQWILPLITEQSEYVAGLSTGRLSEASSQQRQEKFLRIALGVFMGLVVYLMVSWPKHLGRKPNHLWLKNLMVLLILTLILIGLMALVNQGILTVQWSILVFLTSVGLRWLYVESI
ncbi:hypothetical protein N9C31_01515 [Gammaproteobacteria bacterium]|nr:hypothetical protein [Gammaproteobacteria bacterium]